MKIHACVLALLLCSVSVQGIQFLSHDNRNEHAAVEGPNEQEAKAEAPKEEAPKEEPAAAPAAAPAEAPAATTAAAPASAEDRTDTFSREVLDQADPEFRYVDSNGNGCISWEEAQTPLREQFEGDREYVKTLSEEAKKENEEVVKQMREELKMMYEHADQNKDGCVDEIEFKDAGEMEGPPPGFENTMIKKIQEGSTESADAEEEEPKDSDEKKDPGEEKPKASERDADTESEDAGDEKSKATEKDDDMEDKDAKEERPKASEKDTDMENKDAKEEKPKASEKNADTESKDAKEEQTNAAEKDERSEEAGKEKPQITKTEAKAIFLKQREEQERAEFDALDINGDGKISQQEAYDFAGDGMPSADVDSVELDKMFKQADLDGDKFITFEEFIHAGDNIEGDGDEMEKAQPMGKHNKEAEHKDGDAKDSDAKPKEGQAKPKEEAKPTALYGQRSKKARAMHLKIIAARTEEPSAGQESAEVEEAVEEEKAAEEEEAAGENKVENSDGAGLEGPAHEDNWTNEVVDQAEYKAAEEMEGAPPGWEESKVKQIAKENAEDAGEGKGDKYSEENMAAARGEFEKAQEEQNRYEFDAMDRSGDGAVSETEAFHFANKNMPHAEVDAGELKDMFKQTDANGDESLSYDEFTGAGERIEGDGNEMENAKPMSFKVHSLKTAIRRAGLIKKLLAHKDYAWPMRLLKK